jgi:Phosphotransferase enzyme family
VKTDRPTRADARFLLAHRPRTALVLTDARGWREELSQSEVEVVANPERPVDLVVAGKQSLPPALAAGPPAVIVEGDSAAALRSAGYAPSRFLVFADETPGLFVPLDDPHRARYALAGLRRAGSALRRVRQTIDARWPRASVLGRASKVITVAERRPLHPFLVAAAEETSIGSAAGWLLAVNEARANARNVFHVFAPGKAEPAWVVKFHRLTTGRGDDDRGLSLAAAAGGRVAAHVPESLGSFVAEGVPGAVETAAVGTPLHAVLRSRLGRRRKLDLISSVVSWVAELARRTAQRRPGELERQFAAEDLARVGIAPDVLAELRELPLVLQHFDLAPANVLIADSDFKIVDWEHARHGLPLLDLMRLLQTTLPLLDGAGGTQDERAAYLASVFAGEHATSPVVGRWIREVAEASETGDRLLGQLAILAWLKLGKEDLVAAWLHDPRLGAGWRPPDVREGR